MTSPQGRQAMGNTGRMPESRVDAVEWATEWGGGAFVQLGGCVRFHGGAASRSQSAPHMHVLVCICSNVRQFTQMKAIR